MFTDFEVISVYTEDQAIDDGVLMRLADNIVCTTNLAHTLSPKGLDIDLQQVWSGLLPIILAYNSGVYYDDEATDYPEEADAMLACYMVKGHVVWVMPSYPGSKQVTIMLPEDY